MSGGVSDIGRRDKTEFMGGPSPRIVREARPLEIVIPPRAEYFSTLRLLATLRGQGAPKNLQCALPGSDFQVAQGFEAPETTDSLTFVQLSSIISFNEGLCAPSVPQRPGSVSGGTGFPITIHQGML